MMLRPAHGGRCGVVRTLREYPGRLSLAALN